MKKTPEQIVAESIAKLPPTTTLRFVSYDDSLRDDQLDKVFQNEYDEVADEIETAFEDGAWISENEYLKGVLSDADRALLEEKHIEEIREEIRERDDSDEFSELLRKTYGRKFRYHFPDHEVTTYWNSTDAEIAEQKAAIARTTGLDPVIYDAAFEEVIANASSGGSLYIYWKSDAKDLVEATNGFYWRDEKRKLTVADNAFLLIFERGGGSGYMADLEGSVTFDFVPENLHTDSGNGSWSDWTCGGLTLPEAKLTFDPPLTRP